jgi:hypothetical protein
MNKPANEAPAINHGKRLLETGGSALSENDSDGFRIGAVVEGGDGEGRTTVGSPRYCPQFKQYA